MVLRFLAVFPDGAGRWASNFAAQQARTSAELAYLGSSTPPNLLPTPDQQRRRRSAKSPRNGPGPMSMSSKPDSDSSIDPVQPALTALQRLSLARKQSALSQPLSGTASPVAAPSPPGSSLPTAPSAEAGSSSPAKPMSKLALLAQKRKEEALAVEKARNAVPVDVALSAEAGTSRSALPESTDKPLSKIAQRMAAARAARTEPPPSSNSQSTVLDDHMATDPVDPDVEERSSLFSSATSNPASAKSPFFETLTSTAQRRPTEQKSFAMNAHFPTISMPDEVDQRVRTIFGEGTESPDDIVLRARQGRGGAAAPAVAGTFVAKTGAKAKT